MSIYSQTPFVLRKPRVTHDRTINRRSVAGDMSTGHPRANVKVSESRARGDKQKWSLREWQHRKHRTPAQSPRYTSLGLEPSSYTCEG
ncbi:hypothetical protein H5410_015669 [Solanum commersonii]|uniref:Uncharacterized protein n=1 Tax=Solanum commersonii TaxID=4109 RepID=A0A9J5ZU55_SOLCO|nr:hypothetical protein H5410_015669 [Solanum commersonii]